MKRPYWDHAGTHYMCVAEQLIDKLQRDYFAGRDLARSIPNLDADTAAVIVAETLEADYCWSVLVDGVKNQRPISVDPINDWSRATTAHFFFGLLDRVKDKKPQEEWRKIGWSLLDEIVRSPTASPLLWYEDIYLDVSQEMRARGEREALAFLKQSLAHNLHYNEGNNVPMILRELAETHLWLGDLDEGLRILTALLRDDPGDIWLYNMMAFTFEFFGLPEAGRQAARRGLELAKRTRDPEQLHDQLSNALNDLAQSTRQNREAEVDSQVWADLKAALEIDFDSGAHQPLEVLCRALVPDLDRIPVKKPPSPPDLPPPDEYAPLPERRESVEQRKKPGRNDPCWCGSGKKYKHCHLRADQQEVKG